jgi:uncharacterized protein involved in exopolysaccharide biosynthesis
MPDILDILLLWWKKIVALMLIATIATATILWLLPNEYLSTATALPVNSITADKARKFNNNIQSLYSDMGTCDELDRMIGTAQLDTIYIAAAKQLQLASHYHIRHTKNDTYEAAKKLKRNTRIIKSDYGELKIKVWDENPDMAAAVANVLLQQLQQIHQRLQSENNQQIVQQLKKDYTQLQQQYVQSAQALNTTSGVQAELVAIQKQAQLQQLQQYNQLIAEYQLALHANPQVLLVVENAKPPLYPDRPNRLQWLIVVFFASGLFAFFAALFLESRKPYVAKRHS